MTAERDRLLERRELALRDLEELSDQVEAGEIDDETAARLRSGYERELEQVEAALGELPATESPRATPTPKRSAAKPIESEADGAGRSPGRVAVGAVVLLASLTLVIFYAARDTEPDPLAVGGGSAMGDLTVDPDSVSNEQLEAVVAANPEITAMRMALADRYFGAEEYGASLDHYLYIAENSTIPSEESKALGRIGWMAYITDQAEAAASYMDESLRLDPTNPEAILYRGFITMYGLGDPEAAIPQLEAALELTNLSDNVVSQINEALEEARGGSAP